MSRLSFAFPNNASASLGEGFRGQRLRKGLPGKFSQNIGIFFTTDGESHSWQPVRRLRPASGPSSAGCARNTGARARRNARYRFRTAIPRCADSGRPGGPVGRRKGMGYSWRPTSGKGWRVGGSEPAVLPVVLSVMPGGPVRGWASGSRARTVRGAGRFSIPASGGGGRCPAARAVSISRNRRKSGSTFGGRLTNGATVPVSVPSFPARRRACRICRRVMASRE